MKKLKPLNSIIQICPKCGKVDVYLNDKHLCDIDYQNQRTNDFMDNVGDK